jgi:two-component system chemotaxis response regulator CheY
MKKVLLVNDSKFENIILKDMLGSIGYNAIAADEFDAVAKIESFCPDYVIINRVMKGIHGDELALEIKKYYPYIKCILSSCDSVGIDEINKAGIDAVIKTPIDKEELKTVLANTGGSEPVQHKSKETHSVQGNICMYCECPIPDSEGTCFSFCPFCGHRL